MRVDVIDTFAGPGGWDEALNEVDPTLDCEGIEIDETACATARAAGHRRRRADVYGVDPTEYQADGVIGSPPCQGFAASGLQDGRTDIPLILDLLNCIGDGDDHRADYLMEVADPRSLLIVEPLRYALASGAVWLALEQVPSVLPLWEEYAEQLTARNWWVDTGILNAADFGVPEDRDRAILVAHAVRPVNLPKPTHVDRLGADTVLGPGLVGFPRRNDRPDGGLYRARDMRRTELPAFTVTEKARSWTFIPDGGDPRQITASEAGRLQGFRSDYPWQGSRSAQFLQIANAVPPPLGAAVLREVLAVTPRT